MLLMLQRKPTLQIRNFLARGREGPRVNSQTEGLSEKVDETFGGTEPVHVSRVCRRVCPGYHRFTGSVSVSANMTWPTKTF